MNLVNCFGSSRHKKLSNLDLETICQNIFLWTFKQKRLLSAQKRKSLTVPSVNSNEKNINNLSFTSCRRSSKFLLKWTIKPFLREEDRRWGLYLKKMSIVPLAHSYSEISLLILCSLSLCYITLLRQNNLTFLEVLQFFWKFNYL